MAELDIQAARIHWGGGEEATLSARGSPDVKREPGQVNRLSLPLRRVTVGVEDLADTTSEVTGEQGNQQQLGAG